MILGIPRAWPGKGRGLSFRSAAAGVRPRPLTGPTEDLDMLGAAAQHTQGRAPTSRSTQVNTSDRENGSLRGAEERDVASVRQWAPLPAPLRVEGVRTFTTAAASPASRCPPRPLATARAAPSRAGGRGSAAARRRPPRGSRPPTPPSASGRAAGPTSCAPRARASSTRRRAPPSSPKLIPTPQFLPPGYSLSSCVLLCFLPRGEILKSGVGITFGVPILAGHRQPAVRQLLHPAVAAGGRAARRAQRQRRRRPWRRRGLTCTYMCLYVRMHIHLPTCLPA